MNGTPDNAGVFFAALIIVAAISFGVAYFRHREELDQQARMMLGAAVVGVSINGAVHMVMSLGLMPDDAAYWTLNISSAALFWAMFLRYSWTHRRRKA